MLGLQHKVLSKYKNYKLSTLKLSLFIFAVLIIMALEYQQFLVESYMRFRLCNQYIVVSFTTTPYRIDHLDKIIHDISQQNVHIDQIYLSVPYIFKRDNLTYKIPDYLINNKRIKILRTEDYGPGTKLLGVLAKVKLPANSIIITVDDDTSYPENLVLQLAYKLWKNPSQAVGLSGAEPDYNINGEINTSSELGFIQTDGKEELVPMLLGVGGIAFNSDFFDQSVFDLAEYPQFCINSDDLYFSFYLARKNIARSNLWNEYLSPLELYWHKMSAKNDALQKIDWTSSRYGECLKYMQNKYPEVKF
jgi:hypothetical protein